MKHMTMALLLLLLMSGCAGVVDKAGRRDYLAARDAFTVTVFPAIVHRRGVEYDARASQTLVDSLNQVGQARLSGEEVAISTSWRMNEAAMWQQSARDFQAWIATHPIETDFALLPEYLIQPGTVVGVHAYLVDRQGRVVGGWLRNSHWEEYKAVMPKDVAGSTQVLWLAMRAELRNRPGLTP